VYTVLIADDDLAMRQLIQATLSPEQFEVLEARTGAEALAIVKAQHPALVILDQHAPNVDGIDVCRQVKAAPDLRDIRIIMITSNSADESAAAVAGTDLYVRKPFSPLQLLAAIGRLRSSR
jgi:CheY-like chemotaxis protein